MRYRCEEKWARSKIARQRIIERCAFQHCDNSDRREPAETVSTSCVNEAVFSNHVFSQPALSSFQWVQGSGRFSSPLDSTMPCSLLTQEVQLRRKPQNLSLDSGQRASQSVTPPCPAAWLPRKPSIVHMSPYQTRVRISRQRSYNTPCVEATERLPFFYIRTSPSFCFQSPFDIKPRSNYQAVSFQAFRHSACLGASISPLAASCTRATLSRTRPQNFEPNRRANYRRRCLLDEMLAKARKPRTVETLRRYEQRAI